MDDVLPEATLNHGGSRSCILPGSSLLGLIECTHKRLAVAIEINLDTSASERKVFEDFGLGGKCRMQDLEERCFAASVQTIEDVHIPI